MSLTVGAEGCGAGTDAVGERESDPRQSRLLEEEDDEVGTPKILLEDTQVLAEGSGAGVGTGRSGAVNLAGFVWLMCNVRHTDPSS